MNLCLGCLWTWVLCEAMHWGLKEHGMVVDNHTNFILMQCISCDRGGGGGSTLAGEVAIFNVHYQGLGHLFYGNSLSHAIILLK